MERFSYNKWPGVCIVNSWNRCPIILIDVEFLKCNKFFWTISLLQPQMLQYVWWIMVYNVHTNTVNFICPYTHGWKSNFSANCMDHTFAKVFPQTTRIPCNHKDFPSRTTCPTDFTACGYWVWHPTNFLPLNTKQHYSWPAYT